MNRICAQLSLEIKFLKSNIFISDDVLISKSTTVNHTDILRDYDQ